MQQALAVEEDPHAGQAAFARADAGGRIVAARDEDAQHRAGLGIVVGGDHRVDGRGERVDVRLGQVGHRRGRGETAQMVLQRDRKTLPHGRGLEDAETCGCSGSTSSITSFGSNGVPFGANSAAELPIPNMIPVMMLPFANLHMDIA